MMALPATDNIAGPVVRTIVQLTEDQAASLKRLARERQTSVAAGRAQPGVPRRWAAPASRSCATTASKRAFAFDRDFARAGFTVLPR